MDDNNDFIDIDVSEHNELLLVESHLNHAIGVEDKFDVTVQNYLEFETSILCEAARDLIGTQRGAEEHERLRRLFARRVLNVLSSARLYLDSLAHHAAQILSDDPGRLAKVETARRAQYDSSSEYRLAESLRNYAQHRALAVHGLIGKSTQPETDVFEYCIQPYLDPEELHMDRKFNLRVLEELLPSGRVVELKPVMRGYIEGLGRIHAVFRAETRSQLEAGVRTLYLAEKKFRSAFPMAPLAFLGALREENGIWDDVVYIHVTLKKLQSYLEMEMPRMEQFRLRRVRY